MNLDLIEYSENLKRIAKYCLSDLRVMLKVDVDKNTQLVNKGIYDCERKAKSFNYNYGGDGGSEFWDRFADDEIEAVIKEIEILIDKIMCFAFEDDEKNVDYVSVGKIHYYQSLITFIKQEKYG